MPVRPPWLIALPVLLAACSSQAEDPRPLDPTTAETASPAMPDRAPPDGGFIDLCATGQIVGIGGEQVLVPVPCAHPLVDEGDPPDRALSKSPIEADPIVDRVQQQVSPAVRSDARR